MALDHTLFDRIGVWPVVHKIPCAIGDLTRGLRRRQLPQPVDEPQLELLDLASRVTGRHLREWFTSRLTPHSGGDEQPIAQLDLVHWTHDPRGVGRAVRAPATAERPPNLPAVLFVSWNVNSLRARLPRVLELLEQHQPDVVALQETKCSAANFPSLELDAAGYEVVHHSAGQWAGVALLVRRPLAPEQPLLGLPGDAVPSEARWCEATVAGTRFVSTYVPNGRSLISPEFPRKLGFLEAAAERAAAIRTMNGDTALVIAGDLNVAPADADVYDPLAYIGTTHVSEPERTGLQAVIQRGGLVDAFRHMHPDEQQFTWWDYRAGNFHKNLGMRIDIVLIARELADSLMACGIDRNFRKGFKPSDHAPLLVWLGMG